MLEAEVAQKHTAGEAAAETAAQSQLDAESQLLKDLLVRRTATLTHYLPWLIWLLFRAKANGSGSSRVRWKII